MSDKKITDLPVASSLALTDVIPAVAMSGPTTKKATLTVVRTAMLPISLATEVTGTLAKTNQAAQDMGGDVAGTTAASVVQKVNGITCSGTPAAGAVLRATSASAAAWGQLDLADTDAVTGTLPTGNQASQSMGGDCSGTTASCTVAKINATTITTAGGALSTGAVLRVTNAAVADWGAVNLASSNAVTGTLPKANQAAQDLAGDVTGNTGAAVVAKVNGATVPAAGSLTTGNAAYVSGASACTYSALNLAGGNGWVTGVLPKANQGAQDLAGDVTGNTGASVVSKVNGQTQGAAVAMGALAIDWATGTVFTKTLANGSNTITFSNQASGMVIIVRLTGSSSTVTWPTVKWAGGAAPTQTASGIDVYTFVHDGTSIYGSVVQAMA